MSGRVIAVSRSASHRFSKRNDLMVFLHAGLGVDGDSHQGATVQHRSRIAKDPSQPNLRQVHLIHQELFSELQVLGFTVAPGQMGENITTSGIDLLALPKHTRLALGRSAVIEITGLRNPCGQIDKFQPGLMAATLTRDDAGNLIRKAGVMAIVIADGEVCPGDPVEVMLPAEPHFRLEVV